MPAESRDDASDFNRLLGCELVCGTQVFRCVRENLLRQDDNPFHAFK